MTDDDASPGTKPETTTQPSSTLPKQSTNTPDENIPRVVRSMIQGEAVDMDKWLLTLNKLYEDREYSSSQRIAHTVPMLNEEQKAWYEQIKHELQDDWTRFCEQLGQKVSNRKPTPALIIPFEDAKLNSTETPTLEEIIDVNFEKYSGVGDPKNWLLHTMAQFKTCGLRRKDQFEAIPLLLEGEAYLWYVEKGDMILNFESFSKLFLQQFKLITSAKTSPVVGTVALATPVPGDSPMSHLRRTVADDIIKRPTYFRGSQDDVQDWLDKLEQRFAMARWNDENKLHYISIHLQDEAYRWWSQKSSTILTWSAFKDAIIRTFGSTRTQELAFEQLKWYKQAINQSITQYYEKIIELCNKVDPAMPDSLKLKYLMGGIKESLKTHVALQDPKTTDTFLSTAKKIEDVMALTNRSNGSIPTEITLNATAYQDQPNRTNFAPTSNDTFNRNNSRSVSFSDTHPAHYQQTSSGNNSQRQRKASKFTRTNQRSDACYNCGTPGHYARDCTRPDFQ